MLILGWGQNKIEEINKVQQANLLEMEKRLLSEL